MIKKTRGSTACRPTIYAECGREAKKSIGAYIVMEWVEMNVRSDLRPESTS